MRRLAIVPAYNEQDAIAAVVTDLRRDAPGYEVLVVDDGSTDRTSAVALAAGARVVTLPFNLGIGGAVQTGYRFAARHSYDIAIQVDGDGQHDPAQIAVLETYLLAHPDVDMVVGSRFLGERTLDAFLSSRTRRFGIALFRRMLTRITGQPVTDPTSGFRLVGRRAIELFALDYPRDYPEVEAVIMLHRNGLHSAEVAVRMRERTTGRSSINRARSAYYMVKVTLAVVVSLLRPRRLET